MALKPRERVLKAIHHQEPDRVPIVLGVSNATGIKMGTYRQLKAYLGIELEEDEAYLYHWPELGTAAPSERMLECLKSDVRSVLDSEPEQILERNKHRDPRSPYLNSWGTGKVWIEEGNWFSNIHPLADAESTAELEDYDWPDMNDPTRVRHVREQTEKLVKENRYAIMGVPWLLFPFERACELQGLETFLLNMVVHPDFSRALLWKTGELCKELMGNFLRETNGDLDIIKIGDDLGTQESLLISPELYRDMVKPVHADFISFIKERTDARVFFHTDGDVFSLIGDFIEIGIDILNPIQTSAGKMANLEELKQKYGRDMTFCGGIDTHYYLPSGTPEEVSGEVKKVMNTLGPGGGYMVSSVHTIMDDVPPENIMAMVNAVTEYGQYPLE
jgi:uroporphyrinogen decarboxylase